MTHLVTPRLRLAKPDNLGCRARAGVARDRPGPLEPSARRRGRPIETANRRWLAVCLLAIGAGVVALTILGGMNAGVVEEGRGTDLGSAPPRRTHLWPSSVQRPSRTRTSSQAWPQSDSRGDLPASPLPYRKATKSEPSCPQWDGNRRGRESGSLEIAARGGNMYRTRRAPRDLSGSRHFGRANHRRRLIPLEASRLPRPWSRRSGPRTVRRGFS